ncbi:MAG: hypothetical protein RLY93_01510 [Sumerlaeia bacterium]
MNAASVRTCLVILTLAASFWPAAAKAQTPASARITEGPKNNEAQFMGKSANDYPVLQVAIQNLETERTLTVTRMVFQASGTGNEATALETDGAWLIHDEDGDGELKRGADGLPAEPVLGMTDYAADDGTVAFTFDPVEIEPGKSKNFTLLYNMNGSATKDQTFRVSLAAREDVTAGVKDTIDPVEFQDGAFPVLGLQKTIGNGTITITVLPDDRETIPYFMAGSPKSEAFRIRFENSREERGLLRGFSVTASGPLDEGLVSVVDGLRFLKLKDASTDLPGDLVTSKDVLSTATLSEDNGTATFELAEPVRLARGEVIVGVVTVEFGVVPEEYFRTTRFFIPESSVVVEGLGSELPQLPILGEGFSGPPRPYQGLGVSLENTSRVSGGPVIKGSQDLHAFGIQFRNDAFDDATFTSVRVTASGSVNEVAELTKVELWLDGERDNDLEGPGDLLLGAKAFEEDNGSILFDGFSVQNQANRANLTLILRVSLADTIEEGETIRFHVQAQGDVIGTGDKTIAPIVLKNAPLNGPQFRVSDAGIILVDDPTNGFANEERGPEIPRSGDDILLWNFVAKPDPAEPVRLEELNIRLGGSVDHSLYIQSAKLYQDVSRQGKFDPDANNVVIAQMGTPVRDGLLTFRPDPPFLMPNNRDFGFLLVVDLKDAPQTVYGETLQFTIPATMDNGDPGMKLIGELSQTIRPVLNLPFESEEKTIVQPKVTVKQLNIRPPGFVVRNCINNGEAGFLQIELTNSDSERIRWDSVLVEGTSFDGQAGLDRHIYDVWIFNDRNKDFEYNNNDRDMGFARPLTFFNSEGKALIPVRQKLDDYYRFFGDDIPDSIDLTRRTSSVFVLTYSMQSPVPVPVDNSIWFDSVVPENGLRFFGDDSGDEVLVEVVTGVDQSLPGQRVVAGSGEATITNRSNQLDTTSDETDFYFTPSVPKELTRVFLAQVETGIIEQLITASSKPLRFKIIRSDKTTPLEDLLVAEPKEGMEVGEQFTYSPTILIGKTPNDLSPAAQGTIEFASEEIIFTRQDFENTLSGIDEFYCCLDSPRRYMALELRFKPDAMAPDFQVVIETMDDLRFDGYCSLVSEDQIPHTYIDNYGTGTYLMEGPIGRVGFPPNGLLIRLDDPREDLPNVFFADRATTYAAVQWRFARISNAVEHVLVNDLTVETTGTMPFEVLFDPALIGLKYRNGGNKEVTTPGIYDPVTQTIGFTNLEIDTSKTNTVELLLTGSAGTRAGLRDGESMIFTIPTGGVLGAGKDSTLPLTTISVIPGVNNQDRQKLPFPAPPVVIGAGIAYVTGPENSSRFHINEATGVVTMTARISGDRSDQYQLEELLVTASGTVDSLLHLDGAAVRLYESKSGPATFDETRDIALGVGEFDGAGEARIRLTPTFPFAGPSGKSIKLVVDLNGTAPDLTTLQHSLVGQLGLSARGNLSSDLATVYYAEDRQDPDAARVDGPVLTIGKATVNINPSNRVPAGEAESPVFVLPGSKAVPALAMEVRVREIEDITADSLTFQSAGTSIEPQAVESAALYVDINRDGLAQPTDVKLGEAPFALDDEFLTIPFDEPFNLGIGAKSDLLLVYNLTGMGLQNQTLQASLPLMPQAGAPRNDIMGGRGIFTDQPIGAYRTSGGDEAFTGAYLVFTAGILEVDTATGNPDSGRSVRPDATDEPLFVFSLRERYNLEPVGLNRVRVSVDVPEESGNLAGAFSGSSFGLYREAEETRNGIVDPGEPLVATAGFDQVTSRIVFTLDPNADIVPQNKVSTYIVTATLNAPETFIDKTFRLSLAGADSVTGVGKTSNLPSITRLTKENIRTGLLQFRFPSVRLRLSTSSIPAGTGFAVDLQNAELMLLLAETTTASDARLTRLVVDPTGSADESAAFAGGVARLIQDTGTDPRNIDPADTVIGTATIAQDNGRIVFDIPQNSVPMPKGGQTHFFLSADLAASAFENETLAFRIPNEPDAVVFTELPGSKPTLNQGTTLPISSGPYPIEGRRIALSHPGSAPLEDLEILPGATGIEMIAADMEATDAEALEVTSLVLNVESTGNLAGDLVNGEIQVYYDSRNDNRLNTSQDELLATVAAAQGEVRVDFPANPMPLGAGGRERLWVVASFSGDGAQGSTYRVNLTGVGAQGLNSKLSAATDPLPHPGRLVTIAPPRANFLSPMSELSPQRAYADESPFVLTSLLLDTGQAEDLMLESLTVTLQQDAKGAGPVPAGPEVFLGPALSLIYDANGSGQYEPNGDEVLAADVAFAGSSVTFAGLNKAFDAAGRSYGFLITGELDSPATGTLVGAAITAANAKGMVSDQAAAVTGLPMAGSIRTLLGPAERLTPLYVDALEEETNILQPHGDWHILEAPEDMSFFGNKVLATNSERGFAVAANYTADILPAFDLTGSLGQERFGYWVRYNSPNTGYTLRTQYLNPANGSWVNLGSTTGRANTAWRYIEVAVPSAERNSDNFRLRFMLDGATGDSPDSFAWIDNLTLLPPSGDVSLLMDRFQPANGFPTTVRPGTNDWLLELRLRNSGSLTPIEFLGFDLYVQSRDGRNMADEVSYELAEGNLAPLTNGENRTLKLRFTFPETIKEDEVLIVPPTILYRLGPSAPTERYEAAGPMRTVVLSIFKGQVPADAPDGWLVK